MGAEPLSHYLEYGRLDNRTFARPLYFAERLEFRFHAGSSLAAAVDGRMLQVRNFPFRYFASTDLRMWNLFETRSIPAFRERVRERAR